MISLFDDILVDEYIKWRDANSENFSWWNFVNMKADLDTALAFGKFYCPDIIIIDECFILKDKYSKRLYETWKVDCKNDKMNIEKMMNIYAIRDFFHIHQETEYNEEKLEVLGNTLKFFWGMSFKQRFTDRQINVDVFKEEDGELFITVYEVQSDN